IDPELHSFISVDGAGARLSAQHADEATQRDAKLGGLHGVPISIKDQFAVRGTKTTLASKVFADYVPDFDAAVVESSRQAGAIVLGKANMYELATGWGTVGYFPVAENPWNTRHSPGGSSSGSAAGVAAGLAYASIASDGGGSTRIPASYCGVVGIKPTHGLVNYRGSLPMSLNVCGRSIPIAKTINSVGVISRSVEDAAIVLQVLGEGQ